MHLRNVLVALEEVRAVDERDGERLVADRVHARRHADAGAVEIEVVESRVIVDEEGVRAGGEVGHRRSRRVLERDRERVVEPDVPDERRIVGPR